MKEQALHWWNGLSNNDKHIATIAYYGEKKSYKTLKEHEIITLCKEYN